MKLLPLLLLLSLSAGAQVKKDSWQLKYEKENNVLFIDTVLKNTHYDTTLCAVYVIQCDTCEVKSYAAYRIRKGTTTYKFTTTIDAVTRKPQIDLSKIIPVNTYNLQFYKYIRYNKKPFNKSWIILKEKVLE